MRAEIKHELVRKRGKIQAKRFSKTGYDHYHLRVYVNGDVDRIKYVAYELHPTFHSPNRASKNPKDNFSIDFWTWGEFELFATIYYKTGKPEEISYYLSYSDELPAEDSAYIYESA